MVWCYFSISYHSVSLPPLAYFFMSLLYGNIGCNIELVLVLYCWFGKEN